MFFSNKLHKEEFVTNNLSASISVKNSPKFEGIFSNTFDALPSQGNNSL